MLKHWGDERQDNTNSLISLKLYFCKGARPPLFLPTLDEA